MAEQNFKNHSQFVFLYHVVLFLLLVLTLIGSFVNLWESWGVENREYSASLITVLTLGALMLFYFTRTFALKAQDRAIRAEENLRHYVLTGKLPDPRLGIKQIIALRFASDAEFPELAKKAAEQDMAPKQIKESVRNWRPDTYRV